MSAATTGVSFARILSPIGLVNRDDPEASESSLLALGLAGRLALTTNAKIIVTYVVPEFVMRMTGFEKDKDPSARDGVRWVPLTGGGIEREDPTQTAERRLREYTRTVVPPSVASEVVISVGDPAEKLVELVEDRDVELVVIPAYRGRIQRKPGRIGNVTYHVARNAPCSVWIFR